MMNKVMLIGRTTAEPSIQVTKNGNSVAKVTLAVDRKYKNANKEKETDFVPLVIWGKLGETVAQYVGKGKMIAIEGELQIRTYDKDNEKRYMTEVICSDVQFIDRMDKQS